MWKSAFLLGLILQSLLCSSAQTFNDVSRLQFAVDLVPHIGRSDGNAIISPVSMQTVLALASLGAEGQTAKELTQGLHLESYASKEALAKEYEEFLKLHLKEGGNIKMANRIYVDNKFEVARIFTEYATNSFHSGVEKISFANKPAAAANINAWVESKTNSKIKNLMKADSITDNAGAVLVNALYLKANWLHKFRTSKTKYEEFLLNEHDKIRVPMMHSKRLKLQYCEGPKLDVKAVELPYDDRKLKMLILLPNKVDDLSNLKAKFSLPNVEELLASCRTEPVLVSMPKFKFESDIDMKTILKDLGMTTMFSEHADFSGLLENKVPFKITDAKQKVYIAVDENGSEAAAATYMIGEARMLVHHSHDPISFVVNHPFTILIRDDRAVYFLGHIKKPEFN